MADINFNVLTTGLEKIVNKSTDVNTDQANNTKYPSVKAVFDWVSSTYQAILTAINFGSFLNGLGTKSTLVNADKISIIDSEASNAAKTISYSDFQTTIKSGLNNQVVGNMFTDTFSSATNYIQTVTSGSQTFGTNMVTMTGGNSNFATNMMVYKYNYSGTLLSDYTDVIRFKVTADGTGFYGFSYGYENASHCPSAVLETSSDATRGTLRIYNTFSNTLLATSNTKLVFASTDTLEIRFRYIINKVIAEIYNITTPTRTESSVVVPNFTTVEYTQPTTAANTFCRIERPILRSLSGTQEVYSLNKYSNEFQNPDAVIIGDSRVVGLQASTLNNSYASLTGFRDQKNAVWARGGATLLDLHNNISELQKLINGNKSLVFIPCGVNDILGGANLATLQSRYKDLMNDILAMGATPIPVKVEYVASGYASSSTINSAITAFNTWIGTLATPLDFNTATSTSTNLTSTLTNDNIHLNDAGNVVNAQTLLNYVNYKLKPSLNYDGKNFRSPVGLSIGGQGGTNNVLGTHLTITGNQSATTLVTSNNVTTGYSAIDLWESSTLYARYARLNSGFSGNYSGSNVPLASSLLIGNGSTFQNKVVLGGNNFYFINGQTGTNIGFALVGNGLKVGAISALGTNATARLELPAGTATANTAPIKLTSGTNLTTPENGAVEYDGTNYFVTSGSTRYTLAKTLAATATLDFGSTAASSSTDLTITVTGAADGDSVIVTPPNGSVVANSIYTAWVSAANTVTVRFSNLDITNAADPASGTFRAVVFKY